MRYMPERKDLFDTMFEDTMHAPMFRTENLMRTDIRQKDGYYMLDVELPGYKKEDIEISLYNGNLTVSAKEHLSSEEKEVRGTILRQERYSGTCSRTYYVGETLRDTDVKASYENGILTVTVPTPQKKEADEKKYINIL